MCSYLLYLKLSCVTKLREHDISDNNIQIEYFSFGFLNTDNILNFNEGNKLRLRCFNQHKKKAEGFKLKGEKKS